MSSLETREIWVALTEAHRYLAGFVRKRKIGKTNFYINDPLLNRFRPRYPTGSENFVSR